MSNLDCAVPVHREFLKVNVVYGRYFYFNKNCESATLPGGLVQRGLHLVYLIPTEVDDSEMNPAVLLDAHFSEPTTHKEAYVRFMT